MDYKTFILSVLNIDKTERAQRKSHWSYGKDIEK